MKKPRIVVVGSSNTDMIIQVDRIPRPGETILGGTFLTAAGGKGANQAVAAVRAGGDVTLIARVGDDMFGRRALAGFQNEQIDISHVVRDDENPSGVAMILVAKDGENSIAVASGANARLTPADVVAAQSVLDEASVLLMQLETPLETITAAAELAAARRVMTILNPAPAQSLPDSLLRQVSILTPNESEAELLTGVAVNDDRSAERAATALRARGVATVIITLGARGALVADDAGVQLIDGFAVEAVDTTAAGDVFNGALALALGEGRALTDSVRWANAAAAISVTRVGAQPSVPMRGEIDALIHKADFQCVR